MVGGRVIVRPRMPRVAPAVLAWILVGGFVYGDGFSPNPYCYLLGYNSIPHSHTHAMSDPPLVHLQTARVTNIVEHHSSPRTPPRAFR